jgi:hypothetical protein
VIATVVVQLVLAAVLVALGRWGQLRAAGLVVPTLPEKQRDRRSRTIRRGWLTCYLVGALLALTTIPIML